MVLDCTLADIDSIFHTSVQGTYFYQVIFGTKFKFSENQNTLRFHYPYWAPSILLRSDVGLRRTCAHYRTSAHAMCVQKCMRKGFWNCVCDVHACGSFWACDVRSHFCTLFWTFEVLSIIFYQKKDVSKQEKDVLKQEKMFWNRKPWHFVQKVCKTLLLQLFLIFSIKPRMFSLHTALVIQILLYLKVTRVQYVLGCSKLE